MNIENKFDLTTGVSDCQCYVFNKVKGDVHLKEFIKIIKANNVLLKKHGLNKVLSDLREGRNRMSIMENYEVIRNDLKHMELEMKNYRTKRVAVLVHEDDDSHDSHETFSINAGFNIKNFLCKEEALAWLLKD